MTGWIITGAILLFLLFILGLRVTVVIDYCGDIFVRVSTLGITVFKIPASKKKHKKKSKSEKTKKSKKSKKSQDEADSSEKADKPKKEKPTLSELIDLIKLILDSVGKPLKKIFKRIVISHLNLAIVCGGEDAAKAAINYGAANYLLSVVLNLCDEWFTLKEPDEIRLDVDFYKEKVEVKCYVEIRTTVGSGLAFLFTLLGRAIGYYLKHDEAKSAIKKLAAIKK
ncbi:MAG: DUF2953 domain-containing protein [Oscillospiraceae bacterium]